MPLAACSRVGRISEGSRAACACAHNCHDTEIVHAVAGAPSVHAFRTGRVQSNKPLSGWRGRVRKYANAAEKKMSRGRINRNKNPKQMHIMYKTNNNFAFNARRCVCVCAGGAMRLLPVRGCIQIPHRLQTRSPSPSTSSSETPCSARQNLDLVKIYATHTHMHMHMAGATNQPAAPCARSMRSYSKNNYNIV